MSSDSSPTRKFHARSFGKWFKFGSLSVSDYKKDKKKEENNNKNQQNYSSK